MEIRRLDWLLKLKSQHNDIGIVHDSDIVRLIGYHEDALDAYYQVKRPDGVISYCSMVGHWHSLKDIYPNYEHMEKVLDMNNCQREPEFQVTVASDLQNVQMYGRENGVTQPALDKEIIVLKRGIAQRAIMQTLGDPIDSDYGIINAVAKIKRSDEIVPISYFEKWFFVP